MVRRSEKARHPALPVNWQQELRFGIGSSGKYAVFERAGRRISYQGVVKEHIYVGNLIKTIVLLNDGTEVKINRFSMDDLPKEGEMIYLYWHLEKGIVLPEKNLVDTDASRDIEGGDEDEEE